MKKPAMIGLMVLATVFVGCSANKTNVAEALEAGADPVAVTASPSAGAPGHVAQSNQPYACRAMQSRDSTMFCSK